MNGTDGSTTFTDDSTNGHTVTAVGNAQIDTAQSVFGGASGLFDGTGDYLTVPDNAVFTLGTSDFTIDFRVRFNSVAADAAFLVHASGVLGSDPALRLHWNQATPALNLNYYNGTSYVFNFENSWSPSANTWYHVAVVRTGNTCRMFIDGTQIGSDQNINFTIENFTALLYIGANQVGGQYLNGWLDEFRFSVGIARWTANFTPPSFAYTP